MRTAIVHHISYSFKAQDWIFQFVLIMGVCIVLSWVFKFINRRLQSRLARTIHLWDSALLDALYRPLNIYIWAIGIGMLFSLAHANLFSEFFNLDKGVYFKFITEVFVIWIILRFISRLHAAIVICPMIGRKKFDKSMAAALCQLLRIVMLLIGILVILPTLDISISAILAFGGVGALAMSFAAKDTLANFLGGMMVFIDRPFAVGDWIRSPERDIEGTVEQIGWRLTRIRRFNMRPIYIPNALFSTISIETPSRMLNRRIKVSIGIRYCDYQKMEPIVRSVEDMLRNHDEIDENRTLFVKFHDLSPYSLNFLVYSFTKTIRWLEYQAVLQDVLLKIMNIIEAHGAKCAFPTQTLSIPGGVALKNQGGEYEKHV
jgi:MscS family membrane protein